MTLVQARRIALYLVAVAVLYAVVASPDRATDFVGLGFHAVSGAAEGVGDLLAELIG
jgi:hypothetical protein